MATDFTKKPPQILVDLINATNSISLTTESIVFGPVTALASGNRNSGVTITAVPGSRYSGTRDLTYNRVDFAEVPKNRSTLFDGADATRVSELLPQINQAYQINLQPEDYVDTLLPVSGARRSFLLSAKPESYIYRGSVELTLRGDRISLVTKWPVQILNGFNYNPLPPA